MAVKKKHVTVAVVGAASLLALAWLALSVGPVHAPGLRLPVFGRVRLVTSEQPVGKGCPSLKFTNAEVSPDNRRVACIVGPFRKRDDGDVELLEGRKRVVLDGVEGKLYDDIDWSSLTFSPDSRRLAYIARRGQNQLMVVDGVEGPEYHGVSFLVWSPDSRRLAYVARQELRKYLVVDGVPIGPYGEGLGALSAPVFSPDSRHWAAVAEQGYANFLVFDGKQGSIYHSTHDTMVTFSPDGRRIAYVVGGSSSIWRPRRVVVESVEGLENKDKAEVQVGKVYDQGVRDVTFSPDSRRLAYVASESGKDFLVVDGVEDNKRFERASEPVFSPDSRRLAFVARRAGKDRAVIDGVEGAGYDIVQLGSLFSPDGGRTAYMVNWKDEKTDSTWAAVINGTLCRHPSIAAAPVFSPDSAHVAFLAQRDDKKFVIVVDGEESQAYDDCAGKRRLVFDGPNLLRAVMVRNGEGVRVEIRIR